MNASLRELNIKASELARRAEAGETITITDRGRPIAELGPHGAGFRFADRDEVHRAFSETAPIDHDQLRTELEEIADSTFVDPYAR